MLAMFFKNSSPYQLPQANEFLQPDTIMTTISLAHNKAGTNPGELVVGEGVVLNGTLEVPHEAFISGTMNGDLKVKSLTVGSTGKITGTVDCQEADIAGYVKDDLRVHKMLVLRGNSQISGNIFYKEIEIEKGAKISGQLNVL